jgi:uncharacterized lipoprotein YmbA
MPAASAIAPYVGPALRVDSVHVPPSMDRIEITTERAPGEFRINDLDHWAAPLARLARQTLTADLVLRLPAGRVIFPHLDKTQGAIGISVDILAFSAGAKGARLEASWTVTSGDPKLMTPDDSKLIAASNDSKLMASDDCKRMTPDDCKLMASKDSVPGPGAAGRAVLLEDGTPGEGAAATARVLSVLVARLADRISEDLASRP